MQSKAIYEQTLEEIAAAIAHEVKNPLTMVGFNLDILEASDERLGTHKNYTMIRKELRKINALMMDFIYLTGNHQAEKEGILLDGLLDEIEEDFGVAMPNISLRITYTPKKMFVYANENSIRTLFGNIVKNAAEAMDYEGEIQITAEIKEDCMEVRFKDSGPGLSECAREKLFKEHFTTKSMGSGLGLSICKKIAKEHGGDFTLENDEDGGCVATVRLRM